MNTYAVFSRNTFLCEKALKIEISKDAQHWQAIAREYADEYLQPHEVEAELNDGVLPDEVTKRNKNRAIELGFSEIDVPKSHGGLELLDSAAFVIYFQRFGLDAFVIPFNAGKQPEFNRMKNHSFLIKQRGKRLESQAGWNVNRLLDRCRIGWFFGVGNNIQINAGHTNGKKNQYE